MQVRCFSALAIHNMQIPRMIDMLGFQNSDLGDTQAATRHRAICDLYASRLEKQENKTDAKFVFA
jgi:hypothetical protein